MDDLILWDYLDYPALDEVKLNQEKRHYAKKHDFFSKTYESHSDPFTELCEEPISVLKKRKLTVIDFQKNKKGKIQQSSWPQSDRRRSTLVKEIQGIRDSA